jgi:hypothetical protein
MAMMLRRLAPERSGPEGEPLSSRGDGAARAAAEDQGPGAQGLQSVKVAVRVRPLVPAERVAGARPCVRLLAPPPSGPGQRPALPQLVIGKDKHFTFDAAYGQGGTQAEIFDEMAAPLVQRIFEGYNATVFAYGQTGSGKTYTMGSSNKAVSGGEGEEVGMLPRAINAIFRRCEQERQDAAGGGLLAPAPECLLRVSFVEIYNEELKDLLEPSTSPKQISVREDGQGSVVISGVTERVVSSFEQAMRALSEGCLARSTGATAMNEQSSRSHAIFTLLYERLLTANTDDDDDGGVGGGGAAPEYITSKFHMVDLAGSERNKRTVIIDDVTGDDCSRPAVATATATACALHSHQPLVVEVAGISCTSDRSVCATALCACVRVCDARARDAPVPPPPPPPPPPLLPREQHNSGRRFQESVAINQGLLALGNVISALGDERKRLRGGRRGGKAGGALLPPMHVPYRESKLTRILQDSLGGAHPPPAAAAPPPPPRPAIDQQAGGRHVYVCMYAQC